MDLQHKESVSPLQGEAGSVTSRLFEAYLACPTKCYLRSIGEAEASNDFAIWNETRNETYRREGVQKLATGQHSEFAPETPQPGHWKNLSWHFAVNLVARSENMESNLQIVERIPSDGMNKS